MKLRVSRRVVVGAVSSVLLLGCGVARPSDGKRATAGEADEARGSVRSAVVRGDPSPASDDFIVYVTRTRTPSEVDGGAPTLGLNCGGALVAPNLVLTAKHCLYEYKTGIGIFSYCDASGEPQPGAEGGYVTGTIPPEELLVYTGSEARRRYVVDDGPPSPSEPWNERPAARGKAVIDDQTVALCSHDLAFLVLDKPVTEAVQPDGTSTTIPIAQLRLGRRPEPGAELSIAGWGQTHVSPSSFSRLRRAGMVVKRVGPPVAAPNATGDLGPRTFETGPGGCIGDSGTPGFDEETKAVFGVLVRALDLVVLASGQRSCDADTVRNVFMTVADFPKVVRDAFAAAQAEPWLEGRPGPGYLPFGEACSSDLECEGHKCAGLSEAVTTGTCNIACTEAGRTCPTGLVCGASGACETPEPAPTAAPEPPPAVPTAPPASAPPAEPEAVRASGTGCSLLTHARFDGGVWLLAIAACVGLARRIRLHRKS